MHWPYIDILFPQDFCDRLYNLTKLEVAKYRIKTDSTGQIQVACFTRNLNTFLQVNICSRNVLSIATMWVHSLFSVGVVVTHIFCFLCCVFYVCSGLSIRVCYLISFYHLVTCMHAIRVILLWRSVLSSSVLDWVFGPLSIQTETINVIYVSSSPWT